MKLPFCALRDVLGEHLSPGVYALTGPIGSGKTQLALQIASHAADCGLGVTLIAPRIDPRELRARFHGIRRRVMWALGETPELPSSVELVHQLPANSGGLLLADHFSEDPAALCARARRAAIDRDAVVIVVLEPSNTEAIKSYVPAAILRRAPAEIAEWLGVPPRAAAEVDALLVLAPDRPRHAEGWMSIELAVAKNRRGLPSRTSLRFNGGWFEDEPEDVELGI